MISDKDVLLNDAIKDEDLYKFLFGIAIGGSVIAPYGRTKNFKSSQRYKQMIDFVIKLDENKIPRPITAHLLTWPLWDVSEDLPALLATYSEKKLEEILNKGKNTFLNRNSLNPLSI
jgi:hypothetical protein